MMAKDELETVLDLDSQRLDTLRSLVSTHPILIHDYILSSIHIYIHIDTHITTMIGMLVYVRLDV